MNTPNHRSYFIKQVATFAFCKKYLIIIHLIPSHFIHYKNIFKKLRISTTYNVFGMSCIYSLAGETRTKKSPGK